MAEWRAADNSITGKPFVVYETEIVQTAKGILIQMFSLKSEV